MDELVFFQATASAERLSAKLTLMRLDPTVGEDVSGEVIAPTIELVADTTLI